jgi:predicted PurR-regulated permease PerM
MNTESTLIKNTHKLILASIIVIIMVVGKSFLIPLAWSLLIGLASYRFIEKMKEKTILPPGLIILFFMLFIISVISFFVYFFYVELSHIGRDLPGISSKIAATLHTFSVQLAENGVNIPDHIDKDFINDWVDHHSDTLFAFINAFGNQIWHIILIMFYLFFLLYYGELVPQFIQSKIKDDEKRVKVREKIYGSMDIIKDYFIGLLILAFLTGFLDFFVFLIFGLDYALFFAVFLAVLNLIPFVGNPIGMLVVALFTLVTKDSLLSLFMVIVALWLVNVIHENVLRPWLLGDKLKINAFVVFLSVIFGGLIWGISGMILFIPMTGIIKIILSQSETNAHYAILFSERGKKKVLKK